jgi:hypothetical protein
MKKLLEFQKRIGTIKKDAKNPHFKSTYATLTQVLSEVKPVLTELGCIIIQPIADGKVSTIIIDVETNESCVSSIDLPTGLNAQQIGSAITYFRRYTICALLSLEIDDDDATIATTRTKPQLDDVRFENSIKAIQDGRYTLDRLKNEYSLTTTQTNALNELF